jgi:hypothetical protein
MSNLALVSSESKQCRTCKVYLPTSAYTLNKAAKDGLQYVCKSCDKQYQTKRRIENKDSLLEYGRNYTANKRKDFNYRLQMLLNASKQRASKYNREHTITLDDIKNKYPVDGKCPVFGIDLQFNSTGFRDNSPSIDRIDSLKGYTVDNIQIISWKANSIKRNASLEELTLLVNYLNQGE